jgi:hypothetical protein
MIINDAARVMLKIVASLFTYDCVRNMFIVQATNLGNVTYDFDSKNFANVNNLFKVNCINGTRHEHYWLTSTCLNSNSDGNCNNCC